ncbi:MAG: dTMP kinase [Planctomycetaceae bacterium]|nr:dTMP kinase [Planctomycetaceae bacterium]
MKNAPLIVIEGIDGSGKGTHARLLRQRFLDQGRQAALLSFPRYSETFFGGRIGEFLNGEYGSLDDLHPFLVSLLYAGDRFESRATLAQLRGESDVVILDRYVSSNIAHQAAKVDGPVREQLREWIEHLEYSIYELPRPDRVILLDCPVEMSQELIRRKSARDYTDRVTDLQESDTGYMAKVRDVYLDLAKSQTSWNVVSVFDDDGGLRALTEMQDEIWASVHQIGKGR